MKQTAIIHKWRSRQVKAVLDYLRGIDPLARYSNGQYSAVIMPDASVLTFKEGDTTPVPSGKWMDFYCTNTAAQGYSKIQYAELAKAERAKIEAKIQVEKYIAAQYPGNKFDFYRSLEWKLSRK